MRRLRSREDSFRNPWSQQWLPGNRNVQLRFIDRTGHLAATLRLPVDLRQQLPGSKTYLQTVTAPAGPATGTYTVAVAVADPTGYLAPMALANTSRLPTVPTAWAGWAWPTAPPPAPVAADRPARRTPRPPTGLPVGGRLPCGAPAGWVGV